jgi:chromosome segregation ATPase
MENLLKQMLTELQGLKKDVTSLMDGQTRLEQKVDGIYQAVVRIEEGQPKDIYAMLENIDRKLEDKDSEITVLNKRIFKIESDIERLNKQ